MKNLSNQQKGSLLAFIAVFLITPDSLFIRLSHIDTWGLLFYRGAIPFVAVFFGLLMVYRATFFKLFFAMGYPGIFYTITFAVTNITFLISIELTTGSVTFSILLTLSIYLLNFVYTKKIKIKNLPKSGITKPKPQISEISEIRILIFSRFQHFLNI